jgi:quercetin dioxygenase-like cupin family protein
MAAEEKEQPAWQDQGGGVRRRIVVDGAKLMLVEVHFEKGGVGTLHSHPHEQAVYVLSGAVKFTRGDETFEVRAGQQTLVPSGTTHGLVALEETLLLDVFSPPREDFRY